MTKLDIAIIGGGISGLSVLHFVKTRRPELSVQLYEADSRLGGTIGTDTVDGHSFDWGPNGFLDREPLTLQLCSELGLDEVLKRANANISKRFILRGGRLREVPMSPLKFMAADILSVKGRLRIVKEPFARPGTDDDESIYDFASRRIGREAAEYLVQPMVSGVFGGLADRLSLKACFPVMHEMESQYGSLFKAMLAKVKAARKSRKKTGGPAGPGGWLTSFQGGLYRLVERFNELYGDYTETNTPVDSVTRDDTSYRLEVAGREPILARDVVLAVPAFRAAGLMAGVSKGLAEQLALIPYAPIAVVCLGFDREAVAHPLEGFGFLVPSKEGRDILGSIWTSSIFADRAPDGQVQFRTMLGGDGNHDVVDMTDGELCSRACNDLRNIVGLRADPRVTRVYRWQRGIPQFVIGHRSRMKRIEEELSHLGNIHLAGNAYYGIGLNDCVKQALRVVQELGE